MVERKKEGDFVARPIFSRQVSELYYSIRHPDTGEWITNTYRVQGSGKKLSEGWEYTFEYPALDEQPDLDPEQAFLLVLGVPRQGGGERHVFHALIPVHQPKGLWDKVLGALKPDRWARAAAGWLVQGAHGTLCGVVEGITGTEIADCDGEARGLMGDILTGTPPNLTYEHPFIRKAWTAVWAVASGALVVILGWMGSASSSRNIWAATSRAGGRWCPGWCWASPPPPRHCGGAPWSSTWPTRYRSSSPRP